MAICPRPHGGISAVTQATEGAVCTLAIHHFPAWLPAFKEVYRVLSHGRFVLFTSTPDQMARYWLCEYFPEMMKKACEQMPSLEQVVQNLQQAGFPSIRTEYYLVGEDLQDLFLYSGKHRPDFYLDPRIRAGCSSFVSLADQREVNTGCNRLAADIQSGRIHEVIAACQHDTGDYIFVIADKDQPPTHPGG